MHHVKVTPKEGDPKTYNVSGHITEKEAVKHIKDTVAPKDAEVAIALPDKTEDANA
jgi:hypothetical protein